MKLKIKRTLHNKFNVYKNKNSILKQKVRKHNLIMQQIREEVTQGFCYWSVRNELDFFFISYILIITTIMIGWKFFFILKFQAPANLQQFRETRNIKIMIIVWYASFMLEFLFSLVVSGIYDLQGLQTISSPELITKFSVIFEFLDYIPSFTLMTCLHYISYLLMFRINKQSVQNFDITMTKLEKLSYFITKIYRKIRLFFPISVLIVLIFGLYDWKDTNIIKISSQVSDVLYLVDSFVCNIGIAISMKLLAQNQSYLGIDSQKRRKKLSRDRMLLRIAFVSRFLVLTIFVLLTSFQVFVGKLLQPCPMPSIFGSIGYMLVGQVLQHLFPIYVVIKIFFQ